MLDVHIARGAALTVAAIEVPARASRAASACWRSTRTAASPASRRSRPRRPAAPWNPGFCLGSMGIYIFDIDVLVRELRHATPRRARATTSARTSSRSWWRAGERVFAYLFWDENKKESQVLARRGHARRLLRGLHGPHPGRPRLQPLRPRLAAAHLPAAVPARQVRLRRGRAARAPPRSRSSRWAASSRAARCARSILSPGRARALVLRRRGLDPDAQRHRQPPRAHPARDHRPRRGAAARARVIGYDPAEDRRRHTVSEGGVVVVTPGRRVLRRSRSSP